ncbi:hypothetical protein BD309DRAFT_512629 [Dichomitus squalens]|uniref:Uncharacterized protein n=1 Tax=Dichomitus squalens TaxID=114155 RepID=A0A4Q9PLL0_9APHY|nr:hypothetical protein BD309DRAFT_512629 [Dichomitus squalens]TBU55034.1 hypothetical protein BD310DRAFT_716058 [Dichomitus squalens]
MASSLLAIICASTVPKQYCTYLGAARQTHLTLSGSLDLINGAVPCKARLLRASLQPIGRHWGHDCTSTSRQSRWISTSSSKCEDKSGEQPSTSRGKGQIEEARFTLPITTSSLECASARKQTLTNLPSALVPTPVHLSAA